MRWLRERIRHVVSNWNTVDTVGKYFSVRQKDDGEFLSICVRVRVARQLCVVASAVAAAAAVGSSGSERTLKSDNSAASRPETVQSRTVRPKERVSERESKLTGQEQIFAAVSLSTSRHN